jgi:hypothetical protein
MGIIRDGITEPKSYDKSIKITGATNTKKVKCGKQFAANCLFVTEGQRTYICLGHQQCKNGIFFFTPMHVQKYVVYSRTKQNVLKLKIYIWYQKGLHTEYLVPNVQQLILKWQQVKNSAAQQYVHMNIKSFLGIRLIRHNLLIFLVYVHVYTVNPWYAASPF